MASPKRPEGMDFEEFRDKRKAYNKIEKRYLAGKRIWNSRSEGSYERGMSVTRPK
jgi:hypothetical protein